MVGEAKEVENVEQAKDDSSEVVQLDEAIKLHGKEVLEVVVRKPKAGVLRGLSLVELLNMNVDALSKLLPRITSPSLDEQTVKKLNPADLVQLGAAVAGFLVSKRHQADEYQD